jgi:hypothetical protein
MTLTVSQDIFDSMLLTGRSELSDSLFDAASEVIRQGGRVIVREDFANAPAEIRKIYTTVDELKTWQEAVIRFAERKPSQ